METLSWTDLGECGHWWNSKNNLGEGRHWLDCPEKIGHVLKARLKILLSFYPFFSFFVCINFVVVDFYPVVPWGGGGIFVVASVLLYWLDPLKINTFKWIYTWDKLIKITVACTLSMYFFWDDFLLRRHSVGLLLATLHGGGRRTTPLILYATLSPTKWFCIKMGGGMYPLCPLPTF